jgi:hypothetical protein
MHDTKITDVKVQGQPVTIHGATYILPPMPLVKLPMVKRLMQGGDIFQDAQYIDCFVDAIYWSLLRNYPDFQRDTFVNHLDMTNYAALMEAFTVANGFKKPSTDSGAAGEVAAGQ